MSDPELAAVCEREYPRVVGLLLLHVNERAVAEELAQDALVKLCEKWPQVRDMQRPGAWLATVATNLARSAFRRRLAERRAQARHGPVDDRIGFGDPATAMAVQRAVAALPARQRTAVAYRYYAGLSAIETANEMDITPGTVRALCHQAVQALRKTGLHVDHEEVSDDATG